MMYIMHILRELVLLFSHQRYNSCYSDLTVVTNSMNNYIRHKSNFQVTPVEAMLPQAGPWPPPAAERELRPPHCGRGRPAQGAGLRGLDWPRGHGQCRAAPARDGHLAAARGLPRDGQERLRLHRPLQHDLQSNMWKKLVIHH